MKAILLLLLLTPGVFISCRDKCTTPYRPQSYSIQIKYVNVAGKNLMSLPNAPVTEKYDGDKVEVFKVFTENGVEKTELINLGNVATWVKSSGDAVRLSVYFPIMDTRVSKLLIFLKPTNEVDVITYKGSAPNNIPAADDIYYNNLPVKKMEWESSNNYGSSFTVTKP